jgi:hypothetical protein
MSYECLCDYDPPEFYRSVVRTARRSHQCDECPGTISSGERYEYVSGRWEGFFSTFKTCARCLDIRMWTKNNVPCVCWAHGNMIDDCKEAIDAAAWRAPEETRGLRFGFLRRLVIANRANSRR